MWEKGREKEKNSPVKKAVVREKYLTFLGVFFLSLSKRLAFPCLCEFLWIWLTSRTGGGEDGEDRWRTERWGEGGRRRRRMTPIGAADRCVELAAPLQRWGEMREWKRDQWKATEKGEGREEEIWWKPRSYLLPVSSSGSNYIKHVTADIKKKKKL